MNELTGIDQAMHLAVEPLTEEQRHVFSDELHERFPDATSMTVEDPSAAVERAWQIACSRLLSDPLDPIGEAWSRFAVSLFTR